MSPESLDSEHIGLKKKGNFKVEMGGWNLGNYAISQQSQYIQIKIGQGCLK